MCLKKILPIVLCIILCLCSCGKLEKTTERLLEQAESDVLKNFYLTNAAHYSAASDDMGYYFVCGNRIYFVDNDLNKVILLCNKADCNHDPMDFNAAYYCNAYCSSNMMASYAIDECLYTIGTRDGSTGYIYRTKKDGSGSEAWIELADYNKGFVGSVGSVNYVFSDSHCYYIYSYLETDGQFHNQLMQVELKAGATPKVLVELPSFEQQMLVSQMDVYNERLVCSVIVGDVIVGDNELYGMIVDLNSGELIEMIPGVDDIYLDKDKVYYSVMNKGIFSKSFSDMKEESIIPIENKSLPRFGINNDYLFLDYSRLAMADKTETVESVIDIYNRAGQLIYTVDTSFVEDETNRMIMCASDEYLFIGEAGMLFYDVYALNLKLLEQGKTEWKKIDMMNYGD